MVFLKEIEKKTISKNSEADINYGKFPSISRQKSEPKTIKSAGRLSYCYDYRRLNGNVIATANHFRPITILGSNAANNNKIHGLDTSAISHDKSIIEQRK